MIPAETLFAFVRTWPHLGFTPGPSVAYIVTTSLSSGGRSGTAAVAGVEAGYLFPWWRRSVFL